jgi:iron complex outermembrane receptor protein
VSRLARIPTFEELFGNVGGVHGNPRAKTERITTRDLGLVGLWTRSGASPGWRPSWIDAQLSAYRSDAVDLLVFVPAQQFQVAQNISAARLWGVEWSDRMVWSGGLSADLSWTRQWSRDEGEPAYWHGRELPGRPRDEGSIQLTFARPRWQIGMAQHLVTSNYLDRANLAKVPARVLHDLGGAVRAGPVEWIVEGKNLGDQRVEDFDGFPLPGRSFFLGVRVRIDHKEFHP